MSGLSAPVSAIELPRVVKAVRTKAPPVPRDLQQRTLETTAKYVRLARQQYGKHFPMPTVAFDLRGKTAGQAFLSKNLIRYNAVLLAENEADFEADTIPHEVAHLIAHMVYGPAISGHGREWQSVMRKFGVTPRRTHDYDVTNSAVGGVHKYVCNCVGKVFPLGNRKHRQAARGRIMCTVCRGTLRPEGSSAGRPAPFTRPMPLVRPGVPARPPAPAARPPMATPVLVPRPGLPTSKPVPLHAPDARPATPAQLQYALALAHRLGIALLPEHVGSFAQVSAFIERHKVLAASTGAPQPPSDRQLQYARDIARRRGVALPADAQADSRKLSVWIDRNR